VVGTLGHRVARTIHVCILEKESQRQTKMMLSTGVLRAHKMENLDAISVCLLAAYLGFCHVQMLSTVHLEC
jgi:hypothetical protein